MSRLSLSSLSNGRGLGTPIARVSASRVIRHFGPPARLTVTHPGSNNRTARMSADVLIWVFDLHRETQLRTRHTPASLASSRWSRGRCQDRRFQHPRLPAPVHRTAAERERISSVRAFGGPTVLGDGLSTRLVGRITPIGHQLLRQFPVADLPAHFPAGPLKTQFPSR